MITKLRYQLSANTRLSDYQSKIITLAKLREFGYHIVDIKGNTIHFTLKGFGLSGDQVGKADDGIVQYIELENENAVVFIYHINLIYNFLLLICFIFFSFFLGWVVLFLVIGLILFTFLSLVLAKTRHQDLLNQII